MVCNSHRDMANDEVTDFDLVLTRIQKQLEKMKQSIHPGANPDAPTAPQRTAGDSPAKTEQQLPDKDGDAGLKSKH
jgi:hypothetical protein